MKFPKDFRPVAVGESMRWRCSKVAVDLIAPPWCQLRSGFQHAAAARPSFKQHVSELSSSLSTSPTPLAARHAHRRPQVPPLDVSVGRPLIGRRLAHRQLQKSPAKRSTRPFAVCHSNAPDQDARVSSLQNPRSIDFKECSLNDGVIAERQLALIGLEVARSKTDVVLACSSVQNFSPQDFGSCTGISSGNVGRSGWAQILYSCKTVLLPCRRMVTGPCDAGRQVRSRESRK